MNQALFNDGVSLNRYKEHTDLTKPTYERCDACLFWCIDLQMDSKNEMKKLEPGMTRMEDKARR